jgi:hypothetical protein
LLSEDFIEVWHDWLLGHKNDYKALMEGITKKWAEFSTTDISGKNVEYTDYIALE